ncbi:MAG TPA: DUF5668 domain-containing protein [Burkholderiales bacterium]|nr:DUF5668 domain-containing protein [Burkholderiales bacterium]
MLFRSRLAGAILIIVGIVLLASNLGMVPEFRTFFHQWWPVLLIILGVVILIRRQRRWW